MPIFIYSTGRQQLGMSYVRALRSFQQQGWQGMFCVCIMTDRVFGANLFDR